jgi:glucose-1-phosphate adenylyltransferase
MAKDLVIILAGGSGRRLLLLSAVRAKPAVPFAGTYRIVDFALSNCVNSGLRQVFVLSQYEPRSLLEHLDFGNPWDLTGRGGEVVILQPYIGNVERRWYEGSADAVRRNLHFIEERCPESVLILGGDHIYRMDYRDLLEFHKDKNADLTVAVTGVPAEEAFKFGTCVLDDDKRIIEFEEKARSPKSTLASMGIYVFSSKVLSEALREEDAATAHDFGRDIVPKLIRRGRVYGYEFEGYWRDVGTISSYFESSMALLSQEPPVDLHDPEWPILTKPEDLPPARVLDGSRVEDSLISDGCIIEGTVESSIISPGVVVARDAVVRNSIVFSGCSIAARSRVNLSILDGNTVVAEDSKVGVGVDFTPNRHHPAILRSGISVTGKGTYLPPGSIVGRNCLVQTSPGITEPVQVESGESLD